MLLLLHILENGQAVNEKGEKGGKTEVKVLGKSGKIRISTPKRTAVVIDFDEMKERDKNDTIVGKTGKSKHSFNSFAKQDFTFSPAARYVYNGLKTKTFNFSAMIAGTGAILNVEVYVFLQEGEFVNGNEVTPVSNGTVKFNIEVSRATAGLPVIMVYRNNNIGLKKSQNQKHFIMHFNCQKLAKETEMRSLY